MMGISCEALESVDRQKEVAAVDTLFYAPIVKLYDAKVVLSSVKMFARFQPSGNVEAKEIRASVHYDTMPHPSTSDSELYQFLKDFSQNPEETLKMGKVVLDKEELQRILQLPTTSKEVQNLLIKLRKELQLKRANQLTIFGKIFDQKMYELRKTLREGSRLCHFECKIVYVTSTNRTFTIHTQVHS